MNLIFRKYRPNDQPEFKELIFQFYEEYYGITSINSEKIQKTIEEFVTYPEKGSIIIFDSNGIIGYSILINYWSNEFGGNIIFIDEIYFKPEFRHQGLGTTFIKYIIEKNFNNAVAIQLEVEIENQSAKDFYRKLGFKNSKQYHMIYEIQK